MAWIMGQITQFNVLMFVAIVLVNSALGRANTQKMLKELSKEIYNEIEELKDEVRGNAKK